MGEGWGDTIAGGLGWALRTIVRLADQEARRRGQSYVGGHHLAYGLTRHHAGRAAVARAGIDALWWRDHLAFVEGVNAKDCRHGGAISPWEPLADDAPLAWHPRALAILRVAIEEARAAARRRAGPADLLTALRLENGLAPAGTLMKLGVPVAQGGGRTPQSRRPAQAPVLLADLPPTGAGGSLILLGEDFDPSPGHRRALALARARRGGAAEERVRVVVFQTAISAPGPVMPCAIPSAASMVRTSAPWP